MSTDMVNEITVKVSTTKSGNKAVPKKSGRSMASCTRRTFVAVADRKVPVDENLTN